MRPRTGSSCRLSQVRRGACFHLPRDALAGDGDEGVVEAGALDRQFLYAGAAIDQRLEHRLDAADGLLELPETTNLPGVGGQNLAPGSVGIAGLEPHLRPQPVA